MFANLCVLCVLCCEPAVVSHCLSYVSLGTIVCDYRRNKECVVCVINALLILTVVFSNVFLGNELIDTKQKRRHPRMLVIGFYVVFILGLSLARPIILILTTVQNTVDSILDFLRGKWVTRASHSRSGLKSLLSSGRFFFEKGVRCQPAEIGSSHNLTF